MVTTASLRSRGIAGRQPFINRRGNQGVAYSRDYTRRRVGDSWKVMNRICESQYSPVPGFRLTLH
ncbi:hypothetical protein GBA52_015344 [Prunus armeniaca]|nr:hypothetical protein GBA52_015344 [Prunus armeniaca]